MDLTGLCFPFMFFLPFLGYGLVLLAILLAAYYFYSRSRKSEGELSRKMASDRRNV
jgi:vacuolar-type H+-ATPase subunit I/STV1